MSDDTNITDTSTQKPTRSLTVDRRSFLKKGAVAGAGVAALYVAPKFSSAFARPAYAAATPAPLIVISAVLNFSGTGWGGWSCPPGHGIAAAFVQKPGGGTPDHPSTVYLWKPGATAPGATYPSTPFGYLYTPPEEGAIVQNGGTAQSLEIVLTCVPLP